MFYSTLYSFLASLVYTVVETIGFYMLRLETLFFKAAKVLSIDSRLVSALEVSKNGHVSAIFFISPMELFQHPNMPKVILFQSTKNNVQSVIL